MDKIRINDLLVRCIIGARDYERDHPQDVLLNIEVFLDLEKPGKTDQLNDTLDYSQIEGAIVEAVRESRFSLLEALAEEVAGLCLSYEEVEKVKVAIRKPGALRYADSAEVEIQREN